MGEYKRIDLDKILSFGNVSKATYEEAVSEKEPFVFTQDMFDDNSFLKVGSIQGDKSNGCVKLEILY